MKKTLLTLILLVSIVRFVHAQTGWINFKIDDKLSVKLPPLRDTAGRDVMARTSDSLVCFAYKIVETDSTTMAKAILSPGFVDGLKETIAAAQKGIVLGDMKSSKWNNYNCYSVDGLNRPMGLKASFLFLIIGGKVYALGAIMPVSHDINEKNLFFDTLKLN